MEKMNNEKQWSSATPGLLIIMLDQSGSMQLPVTGVGSNESKAEFASKSVNRVISTIIEKNYNGDKPKNRCYIVVIGYTHDVRTLKEGYLSDLDSNPIRVDTVIQKEYDGNGGLYDVPKKSPVWVEPKNEGCTNMKGAFELAEGTIQKWLRNKPKNPAPVIINISDGVPYMQGQDEKKFLDDTIDVAKRIKAIDTEDGKIQIFNAMLGDGKKFVFPTSECELDTPEGKFLYEISTEIPEAYRGAAAKNNFSYQPGARGLICQCDGVDLIKLIDFGSSKGLESSGGGSNSNTTYHDKTSF